VVRSTATGGFTDVTGKGIGSFDQNASHRLSCNGSVVWSAVPWISP